jgi:hypothetical protein
VRYTVQMRKVSNNTHTIGGRSSQFSIDSSIRNEFGWGSHTLEKAVITTDVFHSHCVICVSEVQIYVVLIPNPDTASMFGNRKNEEKYVVKLADVLDIDPDAADTSIMLQFHNPDREIHRRTARIFLSDGTGICN